MRKVSNKNTYISVFLSGVFLNGSICNNNNISAGLQGGRAFFSAVREGDQVVFASNDDQDRALWVQAMYRATGQSYKPLAPAQNQQNCRGGNAQKDAPVSLLSTLSFIHLSDANMILITKHLQMTLQHTIDFRHVNIFF